MSFLQLSDVTKFYGGTCAVSAMSRLPDLQPWHQLVSTLEPRASEMTETFGLDDYLRREDAVFREAQARMDATVGRGADPAVPNRYVAASRSAPGRFPVDFNRTQVQVPAQVRGGALLVHGLTDSPYSMRTVASRLHDAGYYTLSLRMQGHGTVPGGLMQFRALARMRALVVLPTPRTPVNRNAWATRSDSIALPKVRVT